QKNLGILVNSQRFPQKFLVIKPWNIDPCRDNINHSIINPISQKEFFGLIGWDNYPITEACKSLTSYRNKLFTRSFRRDKIMSVVFINRMIGVDYSNINI